MRHTICRSLLLVAACLCLAACCCVNRDRERTGSSEETRWTVGLFFSPWVVFVRSTKVAGGEVVGLKQSGWFVVNSWTFAAFVAGVLLLSWRRRLGQVSGGLPDVAFQAKPT